MTRQIPPKLMEHIHKIQELRVGARGIKARVVYQHPEWNEANDARLTVFAKLINVLNSVHLAMVLIGDSLLDPGWWIRTGGQLPDESDRRIYIDEFAMSAKLNLVVMAFSAVESTMRLILRAIDPNACSRGTAEFKGVYECLLKTKLSATPPDSTDLLDLWRTLRNSIHNNGVYFHKTWQNTAVAYRGKTYHFQIGQPVEFAGWPLLLDLGPDLLALVEFVVSDPIVVALKGPMTDPFAITGTSSGP